MIAADAVLTAAWLPLDRLVVRQVEPRNPDRVAFYHDLLARHPGAHCGPPITVAPLGDGYYEILDGHHRFLAHIIAGRDRAPAVVIGPAHHA